MSNDINQNELKSAASKHAVVSLPDSHDTSATLPHDTTIVAEDKESSKPAKSSSDIDMPQDRHVTTLQPRLQSKSPSSSSTPPLQQKLTMSSPQPQLSLAPSPSLPLSSSQSAAHYQPSNIDIDGITSGVAMQRRSSLPPPPLPSIPMHVKRDMQHMRRASRSPKEIFQLFPQAILYKCVAPARVAWRCAPELSKRWGMRVGLEPGATVRAVGSNSNWIAVELERHRLKYLPLWHPVDGSALFQRLNQDGSRHPDAHPAGFDLEAHLEAVCGHLRRASDTGITRLSELCEVLEKELQRRLRGFEKQEAKHFARTAEHAREDREDDSAPPHRDSSSAPKLTVATSSRQSLIGGPKESETLLHEAKAVKDVADSDDGSDDVDNVDINGADDDDGDGRARGDSGGGDNKIAFSELKAELSRAVLAGVQVDQGALTQWLEEKIHFRPLSDQERSWVAAFTRQSVAGASAARDSDQSRGNEHSASVSAATTSPGDPLLQRATIGDDVLVLPGHPRAGQVGKIQYDDMSPTPYIVEFSDWTQVWFTETQVVLAPESALDSTGRRQRERKAKPSRQDKKNTRLSEKYGVHFQATSVCQLCGKSFTLVRPRHHCRFCGRSVCGQCSAHRVQSEFSKHRKRMCTHCFEDKNSGADADTPAAAAQKEDVVTRIYKAEHDAVDPLYPQAPVPKLLSALWASLLSHDGLEQEGILRRTAQKTLIKATQTRMHELLLSAAPSITLAEQCPNALCAGNLIKMYFRGMKPRLLDALDDAEMRGSISLDDNAFVELLTTKLSARHRHMLMWLLDRCWDILKREPVNRMSVQALAVVLVPNLFSAIFKALGAGNLFFKMALKWRGRHIGADSENEYDSNIEDGADDGDENGDEGGDNTDSTGADDGEGDNGTESDDEGKYDADEVSDNRGDSDSDSDDTDST